MKRFKQHLGEGKFSKGNILNVTTKKFIKGMIKIKIDQLGGRMPGTKFVYYNKPKKQWWFVDFEGDIMELKNKGTLAELEKFIQSKGLLSD